MLGLLFSFENDFDFAKTNCFYIKSKALVPAVIIRILKLNIFKLLLGQIVT